MKKVLLHIATPFAGILTFVITCLLTRLFQVFLRFIAPLNYQLDYGSYSWIWNIFTPAVGMVGLYFVVESIAPSKHTVHFSGVVILLIILCAIEIQLLWLPMIILTIGLIVFLYNKYEDHKTKETKLGDDEQGNKQTLLIPSPEEQTGRRYCAESIVIKMNNGSLITLQKTTSDDWIQVEPKTDEIELIAPSVLDMIIAEGGAEVVTDNRAYKNEEVVS